MQNQWEAEAQRLGYPTEEAMWTDLYPRESLSQLALRFGKGLNTIRARVAKCGIVINNRGGANNLKVELDQEVIDDVIEMGVVKAALKRGIRPQMLYQRIYYKYGTSVKKLKAAALAASETLPPVKEVVEVKE